MSRLQVKCCFDATFVQGFYYDTASDDFFIDCLSWGYNPVWVRYCPFCGIYLEKACVNEL
jgi:hypothetical protein